MKKIAFLLAAVAIIAACGNNNGTDTREVQLIPTENFVTTIDGQDVSLYTIHAGDVTAQITNFGARVVSLWIPDRDGNMDDIELGYDSIQKYLNNPGERFLGATVGPYANRIGNARFELDGKTHNLPVNDNGLHTLHGGLIGTDMVVWNVVEANDNSLVLSHTHPDGQDGFPGNIDVLLTYSVTEDNEFKVSISAETDAPTVCNMTFHPFFNLKGEGNGTITDNEVVIDADATTPVTNLLIPSGEFADVTGTPFDFRKPHRIDERIDADDEQIHNGSGYDHNWVLNRKTDHDVEFAASLYEPQSGRFMEVFTDQPGMQVYTGNFFDGAANGKYGRPMSYRESISFEAQKFPDSPNHDNFPSTVLRPGETYRHNTVYKFSVK